MAIYCTDEVVYTSNQNIIPKPKTIGMLFVNSGTGTCFVNSIPIFTNASYSVSAVDCNQFDGNKYKIVIPAGGQMVIVNQYLTE